MARRFFLLFLVVFYGTAPTRAHAAVDLSCSAFAGQVAINEVFADSGNGFIELKVLADNLPAATVQGWTLFFNNSQVSLGNANVMLHTYSQNYVGQPLSDFSGTLPEKSYITLSETLFPGGFSINPGEILLSTSNSANPNPNNVVVDYLFFSVGGGHRGQWDISGDCEEALRLGNATQTYIYFYPEVGECVAGEPCGWLSCRPSQCPISPTPGRPNDGITPTPDIDHFEIRHDGHALTCRPEEVTVRACADENCSGLFTASALTVTLTPSGWVGGDQQTFTESGTFSLRRTTPGIVSLGIANSSLTPQNPTRCYENGVLGDCSLEFHESGFIFAAPVLTSCEGSIVAIQAVRKDETTQACVGDDSFAGTTRQVRFWTDYVQPASGSLAFSVNGVGVAGAAPGTNVILAFGANAAADLNLSYADAGRLALNARFVGSGDEAGLVMEGANQFVVVPHHLEVSATTDGSTPLDNATATGTPRWKAGEDFHVEVRAVCADGTVTPNFAGQTLLTPIECDPACGALGNGTLAALDFVNGVAEPDDIYYSEVGNLKIHALAKDYLGSGKDVSGTSGDIGRFTPHHFDAAFNIPELRTACRSGRFSYLGESLEYETAPVITVTARNKQGGTTVNYKDKEAWWKITDTSLTGKAYSALNGTVKTNFSSPDPDIQDNGDGTGTLTFSAGDGISVDRGSPVAPFDAEISLEINVVDSDGITAANPVRFGNAAAGEGIAFSDGKEMRWGRLVLENAYGSELLPLTLPLRAEYYNGSGFVLNSADSCTALSPDRLTLTSPAVAERAPGLDPIRTNATAGNTTTAQMPANFTAGVGDLLFLAPGDGGEGWVDVAIRLNAFSYGGDSYDEAFSWLRFDWDGDGSHDDDPKARASFGIYRNDPAIIYWRESVD